MTNNKPTDEQIAGLIEVLSGVGRPDNLTVRALRELQEYRNAAEPVYQYRIRNGYNGQVTEWQTIRRDQVDFVLKAQPLNAEFQIIPPSQPLTDAERQELQEYRSAAPDVNYRHLSELYHAQEKRLFKLARRIKGPAFDKYAHSPSQAIDVLESAILGEAEGFCGYAVQLAPGGTSE